MLGRTLQKAKRLLFVPHRARRLAHKARRWQGARRARRIEAPAWTRVREGFWLKLDPAQYWDREVLIEGTWEPALTAVIRHAVREGETCIDVGAHKGYVSFVLAETVGKAGVVLSFEPDPRAFEALRENLERNAYHQIKLFPVALGDSEGFISLTLSKTLGWSSQHPGELAAPDALQTIAVRCMRFDAEAAFQSLLSNRHLSFLKMDAEGAEPAIWRGMSGTIQAHRPLISLEVNYQCLAAGGFHVRDFRDAIVRAGYTEFFEPIVKPGQARPATVRLKRIDITEERPLLVDTIIASRQSPYYDRIRALC